MLASLDAHGEYIGISKLALLLCVHVIISTLIAIHAYLCHYGYSWSYGKVFAIVRVYLGLLFVWLDIHVWISFDL